MTTKISADNIQTATLATIGSNPKISQIQICDSSYTPLDDTAISLTGGYIKITGTGFKTGASVTVNRTLATSVTWISSTELHAEVGPEIAGTYVVYVVNTDGSVAIRINALTYSSEPAWITDSSLLGDSGTEINLQLSATPADTYSLAAGSTLPSGLTLSSSGLISGTVNINNETIYNFQVVATDAELQDSPRTFSLTITVGDPLFAQTALLLSGRANTFVTDASTNNLVLTIAGDTKPNNFNPYLNNYSVEYYTKTDYVSVPANTDLKTFAGDFTFEAWIYPTDTSITQWKIWDSRQSGATAQAMVLGLAPLSTAVTGQGRLNYYNGTNYYGTGIVYYNRWTHIAFVRSGTTLTFYIDGVAGGTATVSGTQSGTASTNPIWIGTKDNGLAGYGTFGYMSNFRIVNGTAVYTSDFTPSTEPLTAVENTALLTFQDNTYVDNGPNNYTLTPSSTKISGFSPFVEPASTNGSAYFDGSGDVLTLSANAALGFGTGDFTIELWYYTTVAPTSSNVCLYNNYSGNFFLQVRSTAFGIGLVSVTENNSFSFNFIAGQWYHIAVARSGSTVRGFVNGVLVGTGSNSVNYGQNGAIIGGLNSSSQLVTGYISNLHIVKGTAVYTDNFTPPTQPLTAVANTSLLTLQNNTPQNNNQFLDSSTNNLLVTSAGNTTQGSFSPYSPSGWSNYFDGTGDYLTVGSSANLALSAADWTVEAWIYPTSVAIAQNIIADWRNSNSGLPVLYMVNNQVWWRESSATRITSSSTLNANTWYHVAVVKTSTTTTMYINGVSVGSYTDTTNYLNADFKIGKAWDANYWNGYISNLRIVKGTAVYTSNFTPSTTPLTAVPGTVLLTCQSPQFVDNSPNRFALTRAGDARVTNFAPYKAATQTPQTYSGFFDGNGDYLTVASNAAFGFGTSDFTIECWLYPTNAGAALQQVYDNRTSTDSKANFGIRTNTITYSSGSSILLTSAANSIINNTWQHVAVVRASGTTKIYINGTQSGTSYNDTNNYASPAECVLATPSDARGSSQYSFAGSISNMRVVKGTALYTTNFTPSTAPLTAVAGTSLLTCQSPTFVDNSTNNFAITAAGNSQPSMVNPFGSTFVNSTGYTAAEYSGSMYFDGNGDYLTTSSTAFDISGSSSWTMQWWIYPTLASTSQFMWQNYTTSGTTIYGQSILWDSNNTILFEVWQGSSAASQFSLRSGTLTINEWHHIAVVRDGSGTNNSRLFIDGILAAQGTWTTHAAPGSTLTYIGARNYNGLKNYFAGYISDLQVIKGTAIYTSNFVPPTAPVLPVPNTTLLLNGTSAAIADATTKNVLETVGNAKISTAVAKFGFSSISFDGTGDYLAVLNNTLFDFGTGDFTVETWIAVTSTGFDNTIAGGTGATNGSWMFSLRNSTQLSWGRNHTGWDITTSNITFAANTWYHVAACRSGSTLKLFVDGVEKASATNTLAYPMSPQLAIGARQLTTNALGAGVFMNGSLQDFRVTKGVARYTSDFNPPTAPFNIK